MFSTISATICSRTAQVRRDAVGEDLAELVLVGREVEHGDLALRQRVGEACGHHVAHLVADLVDGEPPVRADDVLQERRRIRHLDREAAERAQPRRAELRRRAA
jgi:hypothetical protein